LITVFGSRFFMGIYGIFSYAKNG